ncbi:MAG: tRNA (N6-isopentenyl adenosine(37)-C2)-methylthiotransferase MiaB, partial [Nitrospirae bacterium]|nr:tRNA (N6-isopentenyl adenosine(37)-C2)-methylthiotransferase MiaB [Nitrospirota bacterium]
MKYFLKTYGCQMNVHDSEKIAGILSESGYNAADSVTDADVIVLNTCSVRQKAEQKFFSELGRLKAEKKKNPDLKIAVAGCIAQQRGSDIFERFPYVDFIFGPQNIDSLEKWISDKPQAIDARQQTSDYAVRGTRYAEQNPIKREGQVKAWVAIMHGCNNFCSYCVVPYTRGREKSRHSMDILNEIREIAVQGFKEVALLGQNVNSYGKNLPENIDFPDLLKVIHEINDIQRIRFITSHPRDLSEKLIKTMRDLPKVCEHMHLPIQAGSDKILSLMNRGYSYIQYKEKIDMLRTEIPDIAITTDIIVGFPGETDDDFECTVNALKEIEFDGIFAFKYSK